ncbi:helix-turn-helix transcriptional regulator [Paenibacillus cucumis (ex Kampfer et al. 2016)]|uniref:Helix-turn-helix transcriptional regulator n=1 Tax=Paenibacillus cucumis (ex Kampfer et al. 2016) TaxID=1776858 RepID=A0ABS7KN02_9BACL|nr:helix-turn-helix transcriptional regulator [Paenibacillus cucumis (ex Kampfer et al. 2016)]MBY0205301.1 helix-turn-helix transcriptional regulator [Paenibacillus cucumis (ex Kampfer et al. 2016)]
MRKKLRQLRMERGISQTFLSKALGYRYPSGYGNIEAGRNKLGYDQAVIIAKLFGVDVSDLEEEELFFEKNLHEMCNKKLA